MLERNKHKDRGPKFVIVSAEIGPNRSVSHAIHWKDRIRAIPAVDVTEARWPDLVRWQSVGAIGHR